MPNAKKQFRALTENRDTTRTAQVFSGEIWFVTVVFAMLVLLFLWPRHQNTPASISNAATTLNLPAGTLNPGGLTPNIPNAALTPGDVLTSNVKTICTPGYTQTVRNVPAAIKKAVYAGYGIRTHKAGDYEVDHLVSLELGGSNSVRNLWPESFLTKPFNAHVKDEVENKLHALVCAGRVPIALAQQEIANNWVAAYAKYVGPLPK